MSGLLEVAFVVIFTLVGVFVIFAGGGDAVCRCRCRSPLFAVKPLLVTGIVKSVPPRQKRIFKNHARFGMITVLMSNFK